MASTSTNPATDKPLAAQLVAVRNAIETPESAGRALVRYVLSEGTRIGSVDNVSGKLEIPLKAVITPSPTDDDLVFELCFTVLDTHIVCLQVHGHHTP